MSHRGRALSIPEKQVIVHVKHYLDKEKELSSHSLYKNFQNFISGKFSHL